MSSNRGTGQIAIIRSIIRSSLFDNDIIWPILDVSLGFSLQVIYNNLGEWNGSNLNQFGKFTLSIQLFFMGTLRLKPIVWRLLTQNNIWFISAQPRRCFNASEIFVEVIIEHFNLERNGLRRGLVKKLGVCALFRIMYIISICMA